MVDFRDTMEWLDRAREMGELAVIKGADTKYEIGTVAQLSGRNQGPAVLFQEIKGYPADFRILTNMMANIKCLNLTLGLPIDKSLRDTIESLAKGMIAGWENKSKDYPPTMVDSGPILENVVEGDDIDLNIFPVPTWHELDGGPYIGTADSVITRDPDTGVVNAGTYRGQLHDRNSVGMMVTHGHHGYIHRQKYFAKGERCPVVMVFGVEPLLWTLSTTSISPDISELNYAGAIRGEPLPVIKGRVTGLPIPANAEIAIEGFAEPGVTKKEGRFGEWQGYYAGGVTEQPFVKASTLYYRNAPILTGAPPAKGAYNPYGLARSTWRSAHVWNEIVAAGVPGVKGVWLPPCGGSWYLQIVSIEQRYGGHATHAGHAVAHSRSGAFSARYTIVVDDDVNPYDLEDVMWAVCTRSLPTDADIIKKGWGSHSEPLFRRTSAAPVDSTPPRAIVYAVKPYEWRNEFAPVNLASEEMRSRAFAKWKDAFNGRLQII